MKKKEDIISFDFQGWPNYKKNLREILEGMGATEENGVIGFKTNDPILEKYPITVEDDGMAYGTNPKFIVEIDRNEYDCMLFIDNERNLNENEE